MIKIENLRVFNLEGALRGMRFPMQSSDKADSKHVPIDPELRPGFTHYLVGENDLALAKKLVAAGHSSHSKFMRQILVSMDIVGPIFWWKEMDTYKVATVANSESTMHRIHSKPITMDDFSFDGVNLDTENGDISYFTVEHGGEMTFPELIVEMCEDLRKKYIETGDKNYWRALIQTLPSSYNQKRHWTGNYAVLQNIIQTRTNHRLVEWTEFINYCCEHLPLLEDLTRRGNTKTTK